MSYLGFDVLEGARHNARESIAQSFGRLGELLDSGTGPRAWVEAGGVSIPTRTFTWTARSRAELLELRAFLEARRGRRIPFWTPTFSWDLELAADAVAEATTITVRATGYAEFLFSSPARQHLAIFPPGADPIFRKVSSLEQGDGTETLFLDAPLGVALPAAYSRICYLVLCRLAEDLTRIRYYGTEVAEATIDFVELPREVPE